MTNKLLVIGNGQHSKVVCATAIDNQDFKIIGVLGTGIKSKNKKNSIFFKYKKCSLKYLGNLEEIKKLAFDQIVIAVGDNSVRKNIYKKIKAQLRKKKLIFAKIISKNAQISYGTKIGPGTVILSGVNININTSIGSNCLINNSCSINHDNKINNFASIAPGVITGGNVVVEKNSHIGIAAKIKNNIKIGSNTIVGGGSYVNKNCKSNFIYYGVPAIPIRKRNKSEKYY
tara:strand:- start:4116 stop:4802 length:687 start_codon:yes stop_codon:yes gene_type:complete